VGKHGFAALGLANVQSIIRSVATVVMF